MDVDDPARPREEVAGSGSACSARARRASHVAARAARAARASASALASRPSTGTWWNGDAEAARATARWSGWLETTSDDVAAELAALRAARAARAGSGRVARDEDRNAPRPTRRRHAPVHRKAPATSVSNSARKPSMRCSQARQVERHAQEEVSAAGRRRVLGRLDDVGSALGQEPRHRGDDPRPVGAVDQQPGAVTRHRAPQPLPRAAPRHAAARGACRAARRASYSDGARGGCGRRSTPVAATPATPASPRSFQRRLHRVAYVTGR